jgi:hypothetical protein
MGLIFSTQTKRFYYDGDELSSVVPKILFYRHSNGSCYVSEISYNRINDLACSDLSPMWINVIMSRLGSDDVKIFEKNVKEIPATDLILYSHWPRKSKRYWELL